MVNNNSVTADQKIKRFIKEFGGITNEQIDKLLTPTELKSKNYYINKLKRVVLKETREGYIAINSKVSFSNAYKCCTWVMLDNLDPNVDYEDLSFFRAEKPSHVIYLKNNKTYNLMYVDLNSKGSIEYFQEEFAKNRTGKSDDSFSVVFVFDDKRMFDLLNNTDIYIPYQLAYVNFCDGDTPFVEYRS